MWIFESQVIRSSLGAIFNLPIFSLSDEAFSSFVGHYCLLLTSLTPEAKDSFYSLDLNKSSQVILLGSEAHGIRQVWKDKSDQLASIPMRSSLVDSLNVSVSAAIVAYERLRQSSWSPFLRLPE